MFGENLYIDYYELVFLAVLKTGDIRYQKLSKSKDGTAPKTLLKIFLGAFL